MKKGTLKGYLTLFTTISCWLFLGNVAAFAAPVLSGIETKNLEYTVGSGKQTITKSIKISAGSRYLWSAEIRISEGYQPSEDVLSFSSTGAISAKWNKATGTLNLSGLAGISSYQNALRNVKYQNTNSHNPSTTLRTVTFTVSDWSSTSNPLSRNIEVISPDQNPVLFNMETDPVIYCINSGTIAITSSIDITDPDDTRMSSAVIKIVTGYTQDEDHLGFSDQNGIMGSWDNISGTLTLSGDATIENYRDALRSITYINNNPDSPVASYHDISFQVSDGDKNSNLQNRSITQLIPSGIISGNASICMGEPAILRVSLTGTPPYSFSYKRNSNPAVTLENISENAFEVTVNDPGTYTLTAVADKYCPGKTSGEAVILALPVPTVSISGLEPIYSSESTDWIEIQGSPAGGAFSGPGIIPYEDIWYFIPALTSVGINHIVYTYRESPESCYGYDTVAVRILEQSAAVEIENDRTHFCQNDPPFTVTGINLINNNFGSFSINGGIGLTDHGNNTATVNPSVLGINQYTITYTAFDGTTVDQDFVVGNALEADFKWDSECFQSGNTITFTNISSSPFGILGEESYLWKISGPETSSSATRDLIHVFSGSGNYNIELQLENSYGCTAQSVKAFTLKPVIELTGENYFDDFESTPLWSSGNNPAQDNNSWKLGTSEDHGTGASSGESCWYTDLNVVPSPHEHSWITSPCFDFRGTEKPTLVAKIWRSFADNRDGANVQYSTDDGNSWMPVGTLHDGINWYNGYFGNIGEQSQGWTAIRDGDWVETRHILDFLKNEPLVQLRISYNAVGTSMDNKGIAIDDIQIVERNRTILIEHFTNTSDKDCAQADSLLNRTVDHSGSTVIDLQYHTQDPDDPFSADDPVLPGIRQFYYSLSDVPYSIINGGTQLNQRIDYSTRHLDDYQMNIESLYDSDFKIQVVSMIEDSILYAEAVITSIIDKPLEEIALRMVVTESADYFTGKNGRTVYKNIVKAILPDAAGIGLYKSWNKDESVTLSRAWPLQHVYNSGNVRVVAFLQNETTHEIYQAATDIRGIVNNSTDLNSGAGSFILYPNPADNHLYFKLNEEVRGPVAVTIFDNSGKQVHSSLLNGESSIRELSLGSLRSGFYVIRLTSNQKVMGYRKLIIRN